MKKYLLFTVLLFGSLFANAQHPDSTDIKKYLADSAGKYPMLDTIDFQRKKQRTPISSKKGTNPKMLVSYYTWKTLCKGDFSTLTGLDNSATVGKYAALNLNQTTSTFTFTPITINPSVVDDNFNVVQSVDFSGTVDKTSVLDLKNWRTVSLSYSLSWIFDKTYSFTAFPQGGPGHKPKDAEYRRIYDELEYRFLQIYVATRYSKLADLNHPEFASNDDVHKAWLDSVARYEKLLIKNSWTSKRFGWMKFTAGVLSFDNATYVVTGDVATYTTPISKAYYTPSLMASYNYYWGLHSGWNFYVSVFLQGAIKDSFTDIYTTSAWNKNSKLTDSTLITKDTKNVYLATDRNIKTKVLPNTGFEGIILFPASGYLGAGIDLLVGYNGIISNQVGQSSGWLQNVQAGLILSFKDKSGASTINIEPYYQQKRYITYTADGTRLWGVKLSIPFNRLY